MLPTTPEAYLAWEEKQTDRHEFYQGEVFVMPGGTYRHALITMNVGGELRDALRQTDCHVLSGDMRINVTANGLFTYPDVSVVCGEPRFLNDRETTLLNPTLLVEVLSDSTEAYDRGNKFKLYRGLDSLREYLLVSQQTRSVEVFRRDDAGWRIVEPDGEGRVVLTSIGAELDVAAVYTGVTTDDELPSEPE